MPEIPGKSTEQAIRALGKTGVRVIRQEEHVIMSDGVIRLTIARHNPVNVYTMGVARDAGPGPEELKKFL